MRVAVLVPAYLTGPELLRVLEGASKAVGQENVVIIDDGSPDGYPREAERLGYKVLRHAQNLGKGEALKTGFSWAVSNGYEGVVTIDGDGQHDPSLIGPLLEKAASGEAGIIVGTRMKDVSTMPWVRIVVNRTTSWIISRLAGQRIEDSQSGFRFISTPVLEAVELKGSRYDLESEILIKAARRGFFIDSIRIPTLYGKQKSFIRPLKEGICFLRVLFACRDWVREGDRVDSGD
ncbi:MAG: glycosyltransferase family 2 protein [Candidatus Eiseniibacteriota bacterium]|nr:MAG: glycosyltransferase family 2 protein [Candidatus Eisenbacteria bacterium]